jgi:hypothetical protein
MPPAGLEPAIPAGERPQTNALDRAATGIDKELYSTFKSATMSPLSSSSPHQARSFHPILRPQSQYMNQRRNHL